MNLGPARRWGLPLVLASARDHISSGIVWGAIVAWSIALFATVRADYTNFLYARFDLGNMAQAVWSTAHGRPLESTNLLGEQVSRLAYHVDPILVLLAPLWILLPTPLMLGAVQIAACAFGALPVYWLGRAHLGSEKAAALLALSYLAYPWLAWNALDAIHPVTLAIPLLLFAIWSLDSGRYWVFATCAALAILCGELIGLLIAGLGVWYWLARKRRRAGLAIAVGGLAAAVLAVKVVVPTFNDGPSVYYAHYDSLGGSPEGVVATAFSDPEAVAAALTSSADVGYLGLLLSPLAGALLFAPGIAVVAIPQVLAILLSDSSSLLNPRHHYTSTVIPFLIAATVFGVARIPSKFRTSAAALVLCFSIGLSLSRGPLEGRDYYISDLYTEREFNDRVSTLRAALVQVPDDAPVSATNAIGGHLSTRRYIYSVPVTAQAEWIIVEERDAALPKTHTGYWSPTELRRFIAATRSDPRWTLVMDRHGVLVFRRSNSTIVH